MHPTPTATPAPSCTHRFSYCALSCLWLLDRLEAIDVQAAARYVAACRNFDGGFGCTPGAQGLAGVAGKSRNPAAAAARLCCTDPGWRLGAVCALRCGKAHSMTTGGRLAGAGNESHAGQVFTCVAALDIAGRLDLCDRDLLCWW